MPEIESADPLVKEPRAAPAESAPWQDFPAHVRTYNGFLHLLKWFVVHLALLLPALFCFIVVGQPVAGAVLLVIAVVAFGYGVVSLPSAGRDIAAAMDPGHA